MACLQNPCKKRCCCSPDPLCKFFSNLFAVTFLILLPLACYNRKHSQFYTSFLSPQEIKDSMTDENSLRLVEARKYLSMLNHTKLHSMLEHFQGEGHSHQNDIIISIISVSRNRAAKQLKGKEPYYLTQVVWKFLHLLHQAQAKGFPYHIKIQLCNVDQDPENYNEANEMANYISMFTRFNKLTMNMGHVLEKEKQDYVYCLNQSLLQQPGYVLLVEDDALPSDNLFPVLKYTLDNHLERKYSRGVFRPNEENIAYVKFYHPERLLNFVSLEPERLPELLGYGLVFGTFLTGIFIWLYKGNYRLYCVWIVFIVYVILVALSVGRVYINEFRQVLSPYLTSFVRAPSCCTPALLFPRDGATRITAYLSGITCGKDFGKDMALEKYLKENSNIKAYLVQPNTFTHIGMYSSLRSQIVDPMVV